MGMLIEVYRNNLGDSTNNGISFRVNTLNVVNVDGPFTPAIDDADVVILEKGPMDTARLLPAAYNAENDRWEALKGLPMFGGNYGGTCDARFIDAVRGITGHRQGIAKIFDRNEG
jgi:hypothetical protein